MLDSSRGSGRPSLVDDGAGHSQLWAEGKDECRVSASVSDFERKWVAFFSSKQRSNVDKGGSRQAQLAGSSSCSTAKQDARRTGWREGLEGSRKHSEAGVLPSTEIKEQQL